MKVVLAGMLDDTFIAGLRGEFPDVQFAPAPTSEVQTREIKDADVFFGLPTREVFLSADRLRWLHCPGTGIDKLMSVPEVQESDVVVTNALGPHTNPMADHVMGMVLTFAHRLRQLWEDQRRHRWEPRDYDGHMRELSGGAMGIVALGGIGSAVARRAAAFGMTVNAVDIEPGVKPADVTELWGLDRLDHMMTVSDWLVVAVPFTAESEGMIDARRIALLKPEAHIIVVSRGGVVDEDALVEALRSGRLAGVGLDVMATEPLPADSPLWDMPNVLLTPHVSALTPEMWEGRRRIFRENLRRFLANEPFLYVCNKTSGF